MGTGKPFFERLSNPIDLVEHLALANDWDFDRSTEDELTLTVQGTWCHYQISVSWHDQMEVLHLACAFDLKVPPGRLGQVYELISRINEQLWVGHFDLWTGEGVLLYRQGLMLNDADPTPRQCEALLQGALESCERYYQAFQFVIWAGKSPPDALATIMFETQGQA